MSEKAERTVAIAQVVARHWRDAALGWGDLQMDGRTVAHPLSCVMNALDGATDPVDLGVHEGEDADEIRRLASGVLTKTCDGCKLEVHVAAVADDPGSRIMAWVTGAGARNGLFCSARPGKYHVVDGQPRSPWREED